MHASPLLLALAALSSLSAVLATPTSFEGVAHIPRRNEAPVYKTCHRRNTVALTFDDGPWKYENALLNELDQAGAKASFFVNGQNYGCIYDHAQSLRRAFNDGHLVGSHGWEHKDFTQLSRKQMHSELARNERAFQKILGVKPRYFRPPYGNLNSDVLEVLNERGYRGVFLWDRDTKDADGAGAHEGKQVFDSVMNAAPRSAMVLSHETVPGTVHRVMPYALPGLNHAGLHLVTAAECTGHGSDPSNWYERVGGREERNDSWNC